MEIYTCMLLTLMGYPTETLQTLGSRICFQTGQNYNDFVILMKNKIATTELNMENYSTS